MLTIRLVDSMTLTLVQTVPMGTNSKGTLSHKFQNDRSVVEGPVSPVAVNSTTIILFSLNITAG